MAKKKTKHLKPVKEDIPVMDGAEERANKFYEEEYKPYMEEKEQKAIEEFEEIIDTEKDFLALFDERHYGIQVVYEGKLLKFTVRPIQAGDDLSFLDMDMSLYADLDSEALQIIDKFTRGEKLTGKEEKIFQELNEQKNKEMASKGVEIMDRTLAMFLTPPDLDGDLEERLKVWRRVSPLLKRILASETMRVLGLNRDQEIRLFQTG